MNVKLTAIAVAGFSAGGIAAYVTLNLPQTHGPQRQIESSGEMQGGNIRGSGKALIGGPFTLTDHTGKRVSDLGLRGQNLLVYFGFTSCPDICPASLAVITAALEQMGPLAKAITPIFITIDPQRDTPEKLRAYIKSFHPRLIALSGSDAEITAIIKAYRVFARKVPDDRDPAGYTIDHNEQLYLMGPDGAFRAVFQDLTKPDVLAAQIRNAI